MTPDEARQKAWELVNQFVGLAELSNDHQSNCAMLLVEWFAAALLEAAGQWQTMESAPRDGTPVLCALRGNPPLMLPMMWRDGFWWDDIDRGFDEAVTHWRPLPAPPETGT